MTQKPVNHPLSFEQVRTTKERHVDYLMGLPEVVGVGVGRSKAGEFCIKIYLKTKCKSIPAQIEGVPVESEVTGEIVAL